MSIDRCQRCTRSRRRAAAGDVAMSPRTSPRAVRPPSVDVSVVVPSSSVLAGYGPAVDHRTRLRRGRQEWLVVLCLLLAVEVAGLVYGLFTRHWMTAVMAALLAVSMGINVYGQWRRLRAIGSATREEP